MFADGFMGKKLLCDGTDQPADGSMDKAGVISIKVSII